MNKMRDNHNLTRIHPSLFHEIIKSFLAHETRKADESGTVSIFFNVKGCTQTIFFAKYYISLKNLQPLKYLQLSFHIYYDSCFSTSSCLITILLFLVNKIK